MASFRIISRRWKLPKAIWTKKKNKMASLDTYDSLPDIFNFLKYSVDFVSDYLRTQVYSEQI